jgi:hypothetical protein
LKPTPKNEKELNLLEIERLKKYHSLMAERFKYYKLKEEKPKNRYNKINPS